MENFEQALTQRLCPQTVQDYSQSLANNLVQICSGLCPELLPETVFEENLEFDFSKSRLEKDSLSPATKEKVRSVFAKAIPLEFAQHLNLENHFLYVENSN